MKQKKILAICLTVLIVLLAFMPAVTAEVVEPTSAFYVADYANVISGNTEDYIVAINDSLYDQTGAQVVVVTVDFLDGMDIEDYAYTLFNEWGIGSSTYNNGVLILLVIGEDNYWMSCGSGLENYLTPSYMGDLLYYYLEDDFAARDYDSGVEKVFDAVAEDLASYYNVTLSSGGAVIDPGTNNGGETPVDPTPVDPTPIDNGRPSSGLGAFWIILIIIVIIIMISILRRASRRRRYYTPPRYNDPNRNPTTPYRKPPTNSTTKTKKRSFFGRNDDDDTPFGGGSNSGGGGSSRGGGAGRSFFGGSSSSSSSSRSSFGGSSSRSGGFSGGSRSSGGGGSHSGGGGSSRGGGAGRR